MWKHVRSFFSFSLSPISVLIFWFISYLVLASASKEWQMEPDKVWNGTGNPDSHDPEKCRFIHLFISGSMFKQRAGHAILYNCVLSACYSFLLCYSILHKSRRVKLIYWINFSSQYTWVAVRWAVKLVLNVIIAKKKKKCNENKCRLWASSFSTHPPPTATHFSKRWISWSSWVRSLLFGFWGNVPLQ